MLIMNYTFNSQILIIDEHNIFIYILWMSAFLRMLHLIILWSWPFININCVLIFKLHPFYFMTNVIYFDTKYNRHRKESNIFLLKKKRFRKKANFDLIIFMHSYGNSLGLLIFVIQVIFRKEGCFCLYICLVGFSLLLANVL